MAGDAHPFLAPALVLVDGSGTVDEAPEGKTAAPVVDELPLPDPEPPPSISSDEAKATAKLVGAYVRMGVMMMMAKRPEQITALATVPMFAHALQNAEAVFLWYEGAVERVAMKYNVSIPYLDEVIVVAGIGVASAGVAMKPSKAAAAAAAKDANVHAPVGEPPPPSPTVEPMPAWNLNDE